MEATHFRTGAFARKAGVTVRTLRYYDRLGLLKPSAHSESGQRLYTALDFARLQQILTLKLIGLSLREIKNLLTADQVGIQQLLEQQKQVLRAQARQLAGVIRAIERAQQSIHDLDHLDLEQFILIIKAVNMNQGTDWLDQFYTPEQKAKLAQMGTGSTLSDQKAVGQTWKRLFEDIRQHRDDDLQSPAAQQLIERWDLLMSQYAGGDAGLVTGTNTAYAHLDAASQLDVTDPDARAWAEDIRAAARFIERARAVRG